MTGRTHDSRSTRAPSITNTSSMALNTADIPEKSPSPAGDVQAHYLDLLSIASRETQALPQLGGVSYLVLQKEWERIAAVLAQHREMPPEVQTFKGLALLHGNQSRPAGNAFERAMQDGPPQELRAFLQRALMLSEMEADARFTVALDRRESRGLKTGPKELGTILNPDDPKRWGKLPLEAFQRETKLNIAHILKNLKPEDPEIVILENKILAESAPVAPPPVQRIKLPPQIIAPDKITEAVPLQAQMPRKRGRPKGSKNKPKPNLS